MRPCSFEPVTATAPAQKFLLLLAPFQMAFSSNCLILSLCIACMVTLKAQVTGLEGTTAEPDQEERVKSHSYGRGLPHE